MRKNKTSRIFVIVFCALLTTAFFTESGFAQNKEETTTPYSFSYMQVRPGMDVEFEDFVKSKIPFLKKLGVTDLTVFKTSNFGTSGKYLFVSPLGAPEKADAELASDRSMMPVELVSVFSALNRMVVSSHDFMLIPQDDMNVPPPEGYVFKVVACITMGTVPGSSEEFKKEYKKMINVMAKGNTKGILVGKVGFGGDLDEYITFGLFDSFKEIASHSAKVQKEMESINTKHLMKLLRYRKGETFVRIPELCIVP